MNVSALLDFHRGTGTDHAGRRREEILAWGPERLEGVHDYIQWLFPLTEPSAYNPWAPSLARDDIAAFHADPVLRDRLRHALLVMLAFYGLSGEDAESGEKGRCIRPGPDFASRAGVWLTPGNHNHLRLTRILKSLTLLGLPAYARSLLECLERIAAGAGGAISPATLGHWRRAVGANQASASG